MAVYQHISFSRSLVPEGVGGGGEEEVFENVRFLQNEKVIKG